MLTLEHVAIKDYKSIKSLEYDILPGVYRTTAKVIDGEYKSNGGGKSSALQAVFLGLYGMDFQGAPIDSISNRVTKQPFVISIDFTVTFGNDVTHYKVINDRRKRKHYLYKDEKLISSTYKETGKHITNIFGMSAQTFKFTHYITTSTILSLTANLTNATLFNEILQVTQLRFINEKIRKVKKELTNRINELQVSLEIAKQQEQLKNTLHGASIDTIEQTLIDLHERLIQAQAQKELVIEPLEASISELDQELLQVNRTIKDKQKVLDTGICPTCHTLLADPELIAETTKDIESLLAANKEYAGQIDALKVELSKQHQRWHKAILPLQAEEKDLLRKKEAFITLQKAFKDTKATLCSDRLSREYEELKETFAFFHAADAAIKQGEIFEAIMRDFFLVVNGNIQKYRGLINFSQFEVEAIPERSGMRVALKADGAPIAIESLSNGEKARLSLLILASLLESMHDVSGVHTNFIVFDEATSSFDAAGLSDLKQLFKHLVSIGQACFIISHGEELNEVDFTGILKVVKQDNVSTGKLQLF